MLLDAIGFPGMGFHTNPCFCIINHCAKNVKPPIFRGLGLLHGFCGRAKGQKSPKFRRFFDFGRVGGRNRNVRLQFPKTTYLRDF